MCNNLDGIKRVVDNILGSPKNNYGGSGNWYEYNCPHCAEINNCTPDGKFNCAIQIDDSGLWGHCWKCGYSGKLSRIVKKYGSSADIEDYINEITAIKESNLFKLSDGAILQETDIFDDNELELPYGFRLLYDRDYGNKEAYHYLDERGIDDRMIKTFNIGYVGPNMGRYSNRIIIPSYNAFGELNYWIARDYTNKAYRKILNPTVDKKKITFNENLINWYEPITLVEGPFDHIAVPNSIPLLGKLLDNECDTYQKLIQYSKASINILLDDDATDTAYKLYKQLNNVLRDRIRIIECPDGYDASDYCCTFGRKGILSLLRTAHKLDDFTLNML